MLNFNFSQKGTKKIWHKIFSYFLFSTSSVFSLFLSPQGEDLDFEAGSEDTQLIPEA